MEMSPAESDKFAAFSALSCEVDLTEQQRAIISLSLSEPKLTKKEIAEKLSVPLKSVYTALYSKAYEIINKSATEKEKKGLTHLAMVTLRACLFAQDEKVRLNAALRILEDAGQIKKVPSISKTDNKMIVVWGDGKDHNAVDSVMNVAKSLEGPLNA